MLLLLAVLIRCSGPNWRRILSKSSGAVRRRAAAPVTPPATVSCQDGYLVLCFETFFVMIVGGGNDDDDDGDGGDDGLVLVSCHLVMLYL